MSPLRLSRTSGLGIRPAHAGANDARAVATSAQLKIRSISHRSSHIMQGAFTGLATHDGNRISDLGIASIGLAATAPAEPIDIGGNTIVAEATVTMTDGSTRMTGDAVLDISHIDTTYITSTTVSTAAAVLPELRGFAIRICKIALIMDGIAFAFQAIANDNCADNQWKVA